MVDILLVHSKEFQVSLDTQDKRPWTQRPNRLEIRQSKINSRSVAGPMGQMNRRPSV